MNDSQLPLAATVVVTRETESDYQVLLAKRSRTMAFMPNLFAFPGGRVDEADYAPHHKENAVIPKLNKARCTERLLKTFHPFGVDHPNNTALIYAALRELHEETGISIERQDEEIELRFLSRWITPPQEKRRYDTFFFLLELKGNKVSAVPDGSEIVELRWEPLRRGAPFHPVGRIRLAPPTHITLDMLALGHEMTPLDPALPVRPNLYKSDGDLSVIFPGHLDYQPDAAPSALIPNRTVYNIENPEIFGVKKT